MMDPQLVGGEEAALVSRAARGDEAAWEQLLRAHQEPIFRYAYLILGDPDDADDIAQEAFIRAFRSLDTFDLRRPLRPWLFRIVSNQASNRKRSLGRYWGAVKRFAMQETGLNKADFPGAALNVEQSLLWSAIQELYPSDRKVIYLRFFMQLSVEETAQALGVAQGTVKSRSHRALQRLKKRIETDYPDLLPDAFKTVG